MPGSFAFSDASTMIDAEGFRPNVGIVISDDSGRLLWARRVGGRDAWQFPQGGIHEGESAETGVRYVRDTYF